MKHFRFVILFAALAGLMLASCAPATVSIASTAPVTLKIAVLPIVDTLPMYVAQQEGLFAKHDVNVELVPVASAPARDQLIAAGQADGMINETISTFLFNKEKAQVQIVRYALRPTEGAGHFFILVSANSGITSPADLKNVEIGVSQGTVIEYVTDRLLEGEGLTSDQIKTTSVPNLSDRMTLLASGQLKAGVLPDPFGALAVQQGASILMDDSKHPEYGFSVISFRKDVIDQNPGAIRGFLAAAEEATDMLNANPTKYTSVLSNNKLVPPSVINTYKIPSYPKASVPTESEWNDALAWAKEKGLVNTNISYADSVNASFLPQP